MVDSVLSYGAEVWGMQLVAKAVQRGGSTGSAAERLQLGYLRHMLGVRQATPSAVVLAETGQKPLWVRWLRRAAKLWNRLVEQPEDSLVRRALAASVMLAGGNQTPARQPWAAQFGAAMEAVGMPVDLQEPAAISLTALADTAQLHQLRQLTAAAERDGASRLQHYVAGVRGNLVAPGSLWEPRRYLAQVRRREDREALAQLLTGSHWGAEETGRWQGVPREERICPHCQGGVEDVPHILFFCPLYDPVRSRFPDLFAPPTPPRTLDMSYFFSSGEQHPQRLASFARECRQTWDTAEE